MAKLRLFSPLSLQHTKIKVSTLINAPWQHISPHVFNANGVTWNIILFMFQSERTHWLEFTKLGDRCMQLGGRRH